ncbi:hypothetical protein HDU93_002297, partial [Gonapodya sp. JEL0774]
ASEADMIDEGTSDFGIELPYWKEQEEEADQISLRLLKLAGFETRVYGDVLEQLLQSKSESRGVVRDSSGGGKALTSLEGYVSQHPIDQRRVANLKLWGGS